MMKSLLYLLVVLYATYTEGFFFNCDTLRTAHNEKRSGVYSVNLPSGAFRAYCEMGVNGGGYTFFSNMDTQLLTPSDMSFLFRKKNDVLLRISKTDGTQPYTVIKPLSNSHNLSLQINSYISYTEPKNSKLGPYLFLGITPKTLASNKNTQGFISNNKTISFRNCDGNPNSYFAFITNPTENAVSKYHKRNRTYERRGVAVKWRRTAKRMPSSRRMPLDFFLLTELHFGGCGTYTSSDRWLQRGAVATAIGFR